MTPTCADIHGIPFQRLRYSCFVLVGWGSQGVVALWWQLPSPYPNVIVLWLEQQKIWEADWPLHPVQPSSEREPLTFAAFFFFLPKYLSPETLLTAKDIYHSLFAFSFPRHLDLNSHLVMAQRLSPALHICGSSSHVLSTANQTSLIWVACMHLKFRNIKSN